MSVDLKDTFLLSQVAERVMVAQDKPDAIVNVSSVMAQPALADNKTCGRYQGFASASP
jgi:NAD(P)-dependent dehydrogenase (short-subunit alcohol dehydrogenase family)